MKRTGEGEGMGGSIAKRGGRRGKNSVSVGRDFGRSP